MVYRSTKGEKIEASQEEPVIINTGKDGKAWPVPREIINDNDDQQVQKKNLYDWLDKYLTKFLEQHGTFKIDAKNNLTEEDFLRIYDLIESVGRFELKQLRDSNEVSRKEMFSKAFLEDEGNTNAYKTYIIRVFQDIEKEINLY